MKLIWQIDDNDIKKAKSFFEANNKNHFVLNRIKRNIKQELPKFTKDIFWEALVSCLLTMQQRSGPNSTITNFTCIKPFPLNYSVCKSSTDSKAFAESILTNYGGIRRAKIIGEEIQANLNWLEKGGWHMINFVVKHLIGMPTVVIKRESAKIIMNNFAVKNERRSAKIIMENLEGFGPKQSRNLLQSLGLTRYEIPIDSRITKWLNEFGFPVKLSAAALADENYYNFVQDGFQKICEVCNIIPCVMDAAIFSSFDDFWPEEKLTW